MAQKSGITLKTLSLALQHIDDNVMITDRDGIIEYVNPAFEMTTGYTYEEALGKTPKILHSGHHHAEYYQKLWETILSGKTFRATTTNRKKNGDIYYADQSISPVHDDHGEVFCFVSVWKDVTDRIVDEEKLKYEKSKLEQVLGIEAGLHSILDLNKLIDFVVDKTCKVLEAEKCSIMFIDQASGELCVKGHRGIEEPVIEGSPLRMGDKIATLIERHHKTTIPNGAIQKHSSKIDGTLYQSKTFLSVPIELKDRLLGIINVSDKRGKDTNIFTDLDLKILFMIVRQVRIAIENAQLYRELKYLTITDPLTGIYNYRYFTQTLDYEIMRSKRYGRSLSFLMIDIDQFKFHNDKLGHQQGDQILKNLAKSIQENIRKTDVVCRYAGDEFAVILPETDLNQAKITAEKIRKKVSETFADSLISVSIGLASSTSQTTRFDLIGKADSYLHNAKQQGRNQVCG
ncbi:MAG: diguanylate cyclase [Candidatus Omnitrophica bacterium]|nr:diguanylate cyclase [Candidatus Omnitrophota bacterium]